MRVINAVTVPRGSSVKTLSLIAISVVVLLLALVFSASINFAGPKLSLVWAGLLIGPAMLFMRLELLLWAMIVSTFFVVGVLQYFFGVPKAFWIPYLLGGVLLVRLPIDVMTQRQRLALKKRSLSAPLVMFFLLLLGLATSTAINAPGPLQILFGVRDYFGVLALMVLIGAGFVDSRFIQRAWTFMLWMVPLQIPAAIYQRFFVASSRVGDSPWDAVVGLFGGDPEGGGGSGMMAMFVIVMAVVALMRWRNRQIGTPFFALVVLSALGCIALAEVKFSFVLIPVAVALIYGRELLRKPMRSLIAFGATCVLILGIISLYQAQFTHERSDPSKKTLSGYLEHTLVNNLDDRFVNYRTREMGRVAALRLWQAEHSFDDPMTYLLGHGIGSTKMGSFVRGEAATKFSFRIDRSAAAIVLWDGGLFGLSCLVLLLFFAARMAFRLARSAELDECDRALMPAMGVAAILLLLELPYQAAVANGPQTQLLLALVVGYVVMTNRKADNINRPVDGEASAFSRGRSINMVRALARS